MKEIYKQLLHLHVRPEDLDNFNRLVGEVRKLETRAASEAVCPDDCEHKKGRHCLLSANHCIRRAEDYYRPQQ